MPTSIENRFAVIMAGGSGTRLWPLSRRDTPKQFHRFTSSRTLIQETFDRLVKTIPADHIFVCTTAKYHELVREQLPEISIDHLILEPAARNTAAAIALAAKFINIFNREAVIATIASDHAIDHPREFSIVLSAAFETIERLPESLVTVGINPTRPDTGLGYIKMGNEQILGLEKRVFMAESFKEKPDRETAERYLAEWEYLWNAGYFIFSAKMMERWTARFSPNLHTAIETIGTLKQNGHLDEKSFAETYATAPSEAFDTLIVEKLSPEERLVIPAKLKWSDIGNWESLFDFFHEKTDADIVARGHHLDLGSKNILVSGEERLIATLGVKDLIIVDTPDALLVAHRDRVSGEIKHLIEKLKTEGKSLYL